MKHLIHKIRQKRNYSPSERWLTLGMMLILTIGISGSGWFLFGKPAASATSLEVVGIDINRTQVIADAKDTANVGLRIIDKTTLQPAEKVWVGLYIKNEWQRSEALTYNHWYSFESGRAFYQTDAQGQVIFPVKSELAGAIEYQVYAANPELKNDNKYQKLEGSFTINFK